MISRYWSQLAGSSYGFIGTDGVGNAVYYNGKTYIGFIDLDGNARVLSYNHATRAVIVSPAVVSSGLVADIHCTPAVLVRSSDRKLVLAVAPHNLVPAAHMYVVVSTNAEDVSAWGAATDIKTSLGGTSYTYAHLVQLSGESGTIYLFYRDEQDTQTSASLCYSTSTDGGATWSAQTTLYKNTGKQSYWVIGSDSVSRIDFAVSDGNASDGDAASLYHFSYSGGGYAKTDGTVITAGLPLAPADLTKIYDTSNGHVRVPYSIIPGSGPVVAWVAYDPAGAGSNEIIWYGAYSGGTWNVHQITDQGSPPTSSFSDGGVAIDRIDASRVYLSKETSGVFQLFRYVTSDGGSTWAVAQLTTDTGLLGDTLNIRPVSPLAAASSLRCVWCFGPHFTNGASGNTLEQSSGQIRGYPNPVGSF